MKSFKFTRPADSASAVTAAGKSKTAQQGADVRFIAGGTTLVDLMKLSVETPAQSGRHQPLAAGQDRSHSPTAG